jgi:hypothetical protein
MGILLAHVFDASRTLVGDDDATCMTRYARSMNPMNVAPWPGHRRSKQVVLDAGPLEGVLRGLCDLSSEPAIPELLGGWIAEHVGGLDSPPARTWLTSADAKATERMHTWRQLAAAVEIEITPKTAPGGCTRSPDGDETRPRARAGALDLDPFLGEVERRLKDELGRDPTTTTIGRSLTLIADFFPDDLQHFNVKYSLAPDSKIAAIERLLQIGATRDDEWAFVTKKGKRALRIHDASASGANGLYLYEA